MKFLIILNYESNDINCIENIKKYANQYSISLIFDADKSYTKYLNNIINIFYNHCESNFLLICTKNADVAEQLNHMVKADKVLRITNDNLREDLLHIIYELVASTGEKGNIKEI